MEYTKISTDGHCPSCSGIDWKLAKMIVLDGIANIETESEGGGFGVSAGLGRGQGGIGVNYQGFNSSASGTITKATSEVYAPPCPPDYYDSKEDWITSRDIQLWRAARTMLEIDQFALNATTMERGFFSTNGDENAIGDSKKQFLIYNEKLAKWKEKFQKYEKDMAIWNKTRVCTRCGERFILEEQVPDISPTINILTFKFEGQNRYCPQCRSYGWKRADIFFCIKIREIEEQLKNNREYLSKSIEVAKNPDAGGFWKRLRNKLILKPEEAEKRVKESERALDKIIQNRDAMEAKFHKLSAVRTCLKCEKTYQLPNALTGALSER